MIDKMPEILSYIIQGYIFIVAYRWISFKDDKDFTNLIVKSIAASYIIKLYLIGRKSRFRQAEGIPYAYLYLVPWAV